MFLYFNLTWKAEREIEIKVSRESFHLLVHSPNTCNSQGWGRPKPGAPSCMWMTGTQVLGPSAAFPSTLAGSWIGSGVAKTQTCTPVWDEGGTNSILNCCARMLVPVVINLYKKKSWKKNSLLIPSHVAVARDLVFLSFIKVFSCMGSCSNWCFCNGMSTRKP